MISLENVSFSYGQKEPVIRDLTVEVGNGRIYGLFGKNGSGKTTLLKLMSGLLFARRGSIRADGRDVSKRQVETLRNIFFMQAEFRFGRTSLEKFINLHKPFYPAFSMDILKDCLTESGMSMNTEKLDTLSTGEKKKVMFSIALASGSEYLLLDEPMNGMDIPSRGIFRKLLLKHLGEDRTAVISTHIASDMENILSDIMILSDEGKMFSRTLEEISEKYCFGYAVSGEGALYAEPCAGGYRVISERKGGSPTEIMTELLFNAVTKGRLE